MKFTEYHSLHIWLQYVSSEYSLTLHCYSEMFTQSPSIFQWNHINYTLSPPFYNKQWSKWIAPTQPV